MPFNGSGTFSRVYSWQTDKNNSINITASRVDTEDTGFATGLSLCLTKDGQQNPTANLPMNGFAHTGVALATLYNQYPRVDQVQNSAFTWIAAGGTADAITGTYAPAITTLSDGLVLKFRATAANATTTPTFAPNGLTAHTITKKGGAALVAGDITAALAEYEIVYNLANTRWELMNPTLAAASSGALILLTTATASAAASVAFSSTYITSTYNRYIIKFDGVYASTAASLYLTGSTDNGSTYLSSGYKYAYTFQDDGGSAPNGAQGSASAARIILDGANNYGTTATTASYGSIEISNPSASAPCSVIWDFLANQTNMLGKGGGYIPGNTAINNLKIAASTGTFTGNFQLYGVAKV